MSKLKTSYELNILIDKLSKDEIRWDEIEEEIEKIRAYNSNLYIRSNNTNKIK